MKPPADSHASADDAAALNACETDIEQNPQDTDALYGAGRALLRMRRPADALGPLRQVTELQPDRWAPAFAYAYACAVAQNGGRRRWTPSGVPAPWGRTTPQRVTRSRFRCRRPGICRVLWRSMRPRRALIRPNLPPAWHWLSCWTRRGRPQRQHRRTKRHCAGCRRAQRQKSTCQNRAAARAPACGRCLKVTVGRAPPPC